MREENRPIIRFLQVADICFARLYHSVKVDGPCPLPRTGAAILVCNHTSSLDPLLLQAACPRLITWMMAEEYYRLRWANWIFRAIGAIPVRRSGQDLTATRAALRALEQGRVLGMFPEGYIETERRLLPFQTGVALLALKTGAAVYPAYLDGTQRKRDMLEAYLKPARARLGFGPPVALPAAPTSREALAAATERIRQAVAALECR